MPSQVLLFRHYFYNLLVFLSCQIQGKSARFLNFRLIHGPGCVAPPGGGNACQRRKACSFALAAIQLLMIWKATHSISTPKPQKNRSCLQNTYSNLGPSFLNVLRALVANIKQNATDKIGPGRSLIYVVKSGLGHFSTLKGSMSDFHKLAHCSSVALTIESLSSPSQIKASLPVWNIKPLLI